MQEKALTIGKGFAKDFGKGFGKGLVFVSGVIFRAATRFAGSLVADIVCLFMGPMRLYNNIKPTGKQWIAFVFRVLGLSIYNSIALALNATLGLLYNLVESAFMMYELWTADKVTVKELYRLDDKEDDKENNNQETVNAKLVVKFLAGIIDINNPMSDLAAELCNMINENKIFQTVSKKVVELINKLFAFENDSNNLGISSTSIERSIGSYNNNHATEMNSNETDMMNLDKNDNDIEADKPYSLDSIFHPIHSFRAK